MPDRQLDVIYKCVSLNRRNVPIQCKDVAKLVPGVDVSRHAETEHYSVFAIQHQRTVDDVDKQVDVSGIGEISYHGFKHLSNEFDPAKFVHEIQRAQLLFRKKLN